MQHTQKEVDLKIVDELITITPEWWNSAILEAEHSSKSDGTEGFQLTIRSPENFNDFIAPSDELFEAIIELADIFRSYGNM